MSSLTQEKHKARHELLHKMLDELVADFIRHNDKLLRETTVMELMQWSAKQTENPTEVGDNEDELL